MNQSQTTKFNATGKFNQVRARDFAAAPAMLTKIGGNDYDKVDDINQLQINVEQAINNLKIIWKTQDEAKLKSMIKRQIIFELCRLEERKQVRRDAAEL